MPLQPTTATIRESSPRAADWLAVFGTDTVRLKSPVSVWADGPDGSRHEFFEIDVGWMDGGQVDRAVDFLATKFGIPHDEVRDGLLGDIGLPVLAEDVSVAFDARLIL